MIYQTLLLPIENLYLFQRFCYLFVTILMSNIDLVLHFIYKQIGKPNDIIVLRKLIYKHIVC